MWTQQWLSHNLCFVLILPEAAEDLALNLVEELTTHTTFSVGGGTHPCFLAQLNRSGMMPLFSTFISKHLAFTQYYGIGAFRCELKHQSTSLMRQVIGSHNVLRSENKLFLASAEGSSGWREPTKIGQWLGVFTPSLHRSHESFKGYSTQPGSGPPAS